MFVLLLLFLHCFKSGGSSSSSEDLCTQTSKFNIGCLQETLIPLGQTHVVKFQDDVKNHPPPITCSKTCALFYPNTSLALVSTSGPNNDQLGCHCALGNLVDSGYLGPDMFCKVKCNGFPNYLCGGSHQFDKDIEPTKYYSIYCIGHQGTPLAAVLPINNEDNNDDTMDTTENPIEYESIDGDNGPLIHEDDLINKIWESIVQGNVVAIVIIGLLVTILLLLCVIVGWGYMFIDSLSDNTSPVKSAFYRKLSKKSSPSEPLKSHGLNGSSMTTDYGGTNNPAFNSEETRNEILSGGGGADDSTSAEENTSETGTSGGAVKHEGKSKFYNGNM